MFYQCTLPVMLAFAAVAYVAVVTTSQQVPDFAAALVARWLSWWRLLCLGA
jgi:hypothetical protein